jgi:transcriptional regulator with XRE-family HTH domain
VATLTEPIERLGMDRQTFGSRLKSRREAKGLSRGEFAASVGVGLRIVESWEQGRRAPKLPEIPKIADILGCTTDELLRDDDAPRRGRSPKPPAPKGK